MFIKNQNNLMVYVNNNDGIIPIIEIDRRKISLEITEYINMLCQAKNNLASSSLNIKENIAIFDKMIAGMAKLSEFVIKYDDIKFR